MPLKLTLCAKCSLRNACIYCPYGIFGPERSTSGTTVHDVEATYITNDEGDIEIQCHHCHKHFNIPKWLFMGAAHTQGIIACPDCSAQWAAYINISPKDSGAINCTQ